MAGLGSGEKKPRLAFREFAKGKLATWNENRLFYGRMLQIRRLEKRARGLESAIKNPVLSFSAPYNGQREIIAAANEAELLLVRHELKSKSAEFHGAFTNDGGSLCLRNRKIHARMSEFWGKMSKIGREFTIAVSIASVAATAFAAIQIGIAALSVVPAMFMGTAIVAGFYLAVHSFHRKNVLKAYPRLNEHATAILPPLPQAKPIAEYAMEAIPVSFGAAFRRYIDAEKKYEALRVELLGNALSPLDITAVSSPEINSFAVDASFGIARTMLNDAKMEISAAYRELEAAAVEFRAAFPGRKPISAKINWLIPNRRAQHWLNAQKIAANAGVAPLDRELTPEISGLLGQRNAMLFLAGGFSAMLAGAIGAGMALESVLLGAVTAAFLAVAAYYHSAVKNGSTFIRRLIGTWEFMGELD